MFPQVQTRKLTEQGSERNVSDELRAPHFALPARYSRLARRLKGRNGDFLEGEPCHAMRDGSVTEYMRVELHCDVVWPRLPRLAHDTETVNRLELAAINTCVAVLIIKAGESPFLHRLPIDAHLYPRAALGLIGALWCIFVGFKDVPRHDADLDVHDLSQ